MEFSRINERAYSAIFLEGNNKAPSDDFPYRSKHSLANYPLTEGFNRGSQLLGFSHES